MTAATPRARRPELFRLTFRAALLALLAAVGASAQTTTSVTDGSTPSALTPGAPAGSYPLSDFESVNLYNGNLNFALPLLRMGGRGSVGASATLRIEQHWRIKEIKPAPTCQLTDTCQPTRVPNANWWFAITDYNPGTLKGRQPGVKCGDLALTRLTFTAGDGTEYELRDQLNAGQPKGFSCNPSQGALRGAVFVTADGTAATFTSDTVIYDWVGQAPTIISPSGVLKLRDGTVYRIDAGQVTWARDRNGNRVNYTYEGPKVKTIIDTLGRTVTFNYGVSDVAPYGLCDQIVFGGFGGAQRVVRVSKASIAGVLRTTRAGDASAPQTFAQLFPDLDGSSTSAYNPQRVSAVWLPDDGVNRRAYKLFYNAYGELARVELPTGGAMEYDFADYTPAYDGINRGVVERRVYADGVNLEGKTTYSPSTVDSYDAAGVLLARSKHYFYGSPAASLAQYPTDYPGWSEGREYKTEQFGVTNGVASAAPLRRVEKTWRQRAPLSWWTGTADREPANDPRVVETVTTVEPGGANLVTKQSALNPQTGAAGFDQFNNPTDLWEYDYGQGAVPANALRHTHTDYLTTNNGVDYTSASGAHLRGLPAGQQVYAVNPLTGAETLAAKSETRYDEAAYQPLSCGTVETPIPCSSAPQWDDVGVAPRGNATTARRWLDTTNSWLETHAQYDQLGNVRYSWDAKGNLSQVSYLDSFCNSGGGCGTAGYVPNTFAFPTATRSPKPDPSGTYGSASELTASTVYDFYTGLVYSSKDANNQTTTLSYQDAQGNLDPLDRLKAVVRPDGGRTDFEYSQPSESLLYVRTLTDLDGTRRLKTEQHYDKLGRPSRSFTWENQDASNPWVTADTLYDALGRAWKTSNPYRSAGPGSAVDASRAGAETTFDALGQVTQLKTTADGAVVRTNYDGQRVLVTDQAGRQRISKTDALGRLAEVWEVTPNDPAQYPGIAPVSFPAPAGVPAPAYGYQTSYTYDALGNLLTVTQGTQPSRVFAYDSLSRLTSAQNPESGTVSYAYDANGNLQTKTDARGTIATYGYDALNRNVTVGYTLGGQTAATANVTRYYDNPAAGANGLGRPWKSEAAQTALTTTELYDAAGRAKQQTQKFWVSGAWGQAYGTTLGYNLAGGVTSQTYPSGHTVAYQYDAAGRLGDNGGLPAFKGTLGDGVEKSYASQVRYDELGGRSQEMFGTETPVYNKHFYNVRGQLSEIRVSTYSITNTDPNLKTNWNRGALINHYSDQSWAGSGTDNNGNLKKQDVYIPNDDQISGYSLTTQFYDYDALNRLKWAKEGRNGADQWWQQYDYDRWGNRTINAATWGAPEPQFSVDPNTNRLGVPSGQAGQMTYDPAGNLTLDTYQGGAGGGGTRAYDAENRMTSAADNNNGTTSYAYDADGRRVRRLVGTAGEVWQVYGIGGELLAEYAKEASYTQPTKEYGYRGGELLVTAEAGAAGWGPVPAFQDNPLNPNHSGETPVRAQHITDLRNAIDALRAHKGLSGYGWVARAGAGDPVSTAPITEMRAALDEALGAPAGGYTPGLASRQPILAAHIQELRKRVLDAWQAGSIGTDIRWLVSDQLGTPRMVVDKTGSLAGVTRHDYLPFGEELSAGSGGRATTQGYGAADNVRQKFTGKERDNETTLGYLQARYYSNVQGRFTSVDPGNFQARRDLSDPQSWNAYAYVNNNPLRRVDPDGKGFLEKLGNFVKGYGWASNEEVKAEVERRRAWLNEHYFEQDAEGNWHPFNASNLSASDVWTTYDVIQDEMFRYPMHQVTDDDLLGIAGGIGGTGGSSRFGPKPQTPPGTSIKEFGHDVMKWGTGDAEARARIATLTKEELQNAGVTRQIAEAWRDFYLKVKDVTPNNMSAAGRAELMQRAVDLLQ